MEDDFNNKISHSSPNLSLSVNDENESENHQNSIKKVEKTKNFMTPTISATSKSKKKILVDKNQDFSNTHQQKSSNLGSIKSLQKIPPLFSPISRDQQDKPYDPITNYLSPRPKFLLFNPNRCRGIAVSTDSTRVSDDLSSLECCLIQENGVEVEDEEEEEVIEEGKSGFKWELFKCLIVFCVLVFSTMYISSMNSTPLPRKGFSIEYRNFGNISSGVVSLRGSEFEDWFFVGKRVSEMRKLETVGKYGDLMGYNVVTEDEIVEKIEQVSVFFEDEQVTDEENVVLGSMSTDENVEEIEQISVSFVGGQVTDEENVVLDSVSKDEIVEEIEQISVSFEDAQVTDEENVVLGSMSTDEIVEEIEQISVSFEDGQVTDEINVVLDSMSKDEIVESESNDIQMAHEAEMVGDHLKGISDSEPKSEDGKSEDEPEMVTEESDYKIVYESESIGGWTEDEEQNRVLNIPKSVAWVLKLSVITLVVTFLGRFCLKCKKASWKTTTNTSNVKLCPQLDMVEDNSLRLPPKVGEKLEPVQKDDSHLNPSRITPSKTSRRAIPQVKVLSEVEFQGNFSSSMQSKMQENEESRSLQPSRSNGSYISRDKTSNEKGKEEEMTKDTPTPLRRSSRIRSRA